MRLLEHQEIGDLARGSAEGWALGETRIGDVDAYDGREMVVRLQNEYLVVIFDTERGGPLTTRNLRYGFRVTVIGIPSDPKRRTPEDMALGGPRHFGYDIDFTPVEQWFGGDQQL